MTKAERQKVFDKFGGRCAYCGCELEKGWHIDHLIPIRRNPNGTCENPELDTFKNLMPACPSCNINKHSMPLEAFRSLIQNFTRTLSENSTQYKVALRYGLIQELNKPVVFYFETFNQLTKEE